MSAGRLRLEEIAAGLVPSEQGLIPLDLGFGHFHVRILSNSRKLILEVDRYYRPFLSPTEGAPHLVLHAIERAPVRLPLEFVEWPREPGKQGGKEEYCDLKGGRVVHKIRTGMQFLVGPATQIAFGPCERNWNQIVNFVNFQIINHHLRDGWLLGHAAAVVERSGGGAIAIAAGSGGGKSTLAMRLLARGADFVSNDRILVRPQGDGWEIRGVPKLPRINPGTILHEPSLHPLTTPERLATLATLPREELWKLEEKHDVDLGLCFPDTRYVAQARLLGLVVLDWSRRSEEPLRLERQLYEASEAGFEAVKKGPGPFYVGADGHGTSGPVEPDPARYREVLRGLPTVVVSGGVDFQTAAEEVVPLLSLGG